MNRLIILSRFLIAMVMGIVLLTNLWGCNSAPQNNQDKIITISAAISLKEALNQLREVYLQQNNGLQIEINYGSSGTLQHQIEQGAPVDIFISAGKQQMDALEKKALLAQESRRDLLGNQLVLVVTQDKERQIKGFNDLPRELVGKISIGNPETVPAGKYAQQALRSLGLWEKLQDKLVLAKDVRQVLTYVDTGNVDAGLVYESDVRALKKGVKIATAPQATHEPIVYPAACIKNSQSGPEAEAFLNFLAGDQAAEVFRNYGFKPLLAEK